MERIGPDILGRLFDEHAGALALFARQWCDGPDDIVQDAFVALAPPNYHLSRDQGDTALRRGA
jgi:hypothetical protein